MLTVDQRLQSQSTLVSLLTEVSDMDGAKQGDRGFTCRQEPVQHLDEHEQSDDSADASGDNRHDLHRLTPDLASPSDHEHAHERTRQEQTDLAPDGEQCRVVDRFTFGVHTLLGHQSKKKQPHHDANGGPERKLENGVNLGFPPALRDDRGQDES